MKEKISYKQYGGYLKEIIVITFGDAITRLNFFFSLFWLMIGIISNLCVPFALKRIVECFSSHSLLPITMVLLSYGLVWMTSQLSNHIRALLTHKIELRISSVLGLKVLSHLYGLSHSYFLNQKPGALTNIIRRSQRDVPSLMLGLLFFVLPTALEFLFVIVLIAILYPAVYGLLMGGILGSFFIFTSLSMKGILKEREEANEVDKSVDGVVTDWICNYEAIKVFWKRDLAIQTCENELKKREVAEIRFLNKYCASQVGLSFILGIGLSLLTYFVGQDVLQGSLTVGDFVLFNGYVLQFIIPVGILGQITQDIRKGLLDMKGIVELLSTSSDVKEMAKPIHIIGSHFPIQFENVSFKYNDIDILKNVSFKIEAGTTALIVGQTGIGKSTIAKLLMRLYDPKDGQIMIDGIDLKSLSMESLYRTVGWVPQETYLLNDTIQANIHFVRPESTIAEIEEALDLAHLLDSVRKFPRGLNTVVGDRGLKLSGGEKQRISLARIFLKHPKICIFDESTSFLDKNTDLIIQDNIERFFVGATKLVITHRPNLIRKADQIISINNGSFYLTTNNFDIKSDALI